jgi:hypothetical protein
VRSFLIILDAPLSVAIVSGVLPSMFFADRIDCHKFVEKV